MRIWSRVLGRVVGGEKDEDLIERIGKGGRRREGMRLWSRVLGRVVGDEKDEDLVERIGKGGRR